MPFILLLLKEVQSEADDYFGLFYVKFRHHKLIVLLFPLMVEEKEILCYALNIRILQNTFVILELRVDVIHHLRYLLSHTTLGA